MLKNLKTIITLKYLNYTEDRGINNNVLYQNFNDINCDMHILSKGFRFRYIWQPSPVIFNRFHVHGKGSGDLRKLSTELSGMWIQELIIPFVSRKWKQRHHKTFMRKKYHHQQLQKGVMAGISRKGTYQKSLRILQLEKKPSLRYTDIGYLRIEIGIPLPDILPQCSIISITDLFKTFPGSTKV